MNTPAIKFTDQQAAALETPDVSIALSAGAGCGKTFVLTQRFLKYLESRPGDDPLAGIVAITFTDRAAREMRDRIRSACHERLQSADADDADYWLKILRSIDTARITTIHAFCASLLRSHAVDARIDPRFGLLQESLGDTFLRRTMAGAMHDLLGEHNDDCMELVLHYGLERTGDFLRKLVTERFQCDPSRFAEITAEQLATDWLEHWRSRSVPLLIKSLADAPTTQRLIALSREHTPVHEEMQRRWEILRNQLPALAEAEDPAETLAEIRAVAQVQGGGGKKAWDNEDVYGEVRDALSDFRKVADKVLADLQFDEGDVHEAARLSVVAMNVVGKAVADYESGKAELGMLDFDDLLLKTRDLLRDSESVRRQAAAGIDFLMVDEFQDTDPVQSEIVRQLCGERLLRGKLFLVGDAKQSIYRFRRADPRVFASLRAEIPAAGRLPLSVNFRSQPEVLKFVNRLFAPVMGEDYEPLIPHVEQISPGPAIEFLFAQPDARDHDAGDTAGERRRREADWLARRIANLLRDTEPNIRGNNAQTGEPELRTAKPGDVTILFRTLSNIAIYEDALRRYGIDYYLVGGRAFFAQQEIADVANLCGTLNDPDDSVALAGVLRSPFFNLTDETLFAMVDAGGTLQNALRMSDEIPTSDEQKSQLCFAAGVLDELRQCKDRSGLAALLSLAVERTGYDASLLNEHLGRRKLANLDKLIDMARQFDRSGMMTLSEFVQRIRDSIAEETHEELAVTHPESGDVVRLMTVHQSKGLEFPVVIVADMDWMRRGGSAAATFHPELGPLLPMPTKRGETPKNLGQVIHRIEERQEEQEETARVLYVATTRAADRLILSAGLKAGGKLSSPWMKLLDERFDLQTGLPKTDVYFGSVSGIPTDANDIPEIFVHHTPPEITASTDSHSKRLALSGFRKSIEEASAAPLPPMLAAAPAQPGSLLQFSVSELLQADAETVNPHWSPDAADVQPEDGTDDSPDARQLGNLVHAAIENLDFTGDVVIPELIEVVAASLPGRIDDQLRSSAVKRMEAFVGSDLFAEMAAAKQCHRELDFLLSWPSQTAPNRRVVISGQIDCLIQTAAGVWQVVDYKTGGAHGARPESIVDDYAIQLTLYALAVEQLVGRPPDRVEIATLREDVRRFPFRFDAQTRDEFTARIDAAIERLCIAPSH